VRGCEGLCGAVLLLLDERPAVRGCAAACW